MDVIFNLIYTFRTNKTLRFAPDFKNCGLRSTTMIVSRCKTLQENSIAAQGLFKDLNKTNWF